MGEILIVWLLLLFPFVPIPKQDYPPEWLTALKTVSVVCELASPGEIWCKCFHTELAVIRSRVPVCARLPRLAETYILPPGDTSLQFYKINQNFVSHLKTLWYSHGRGSGFDYRRTIDETEALGLVWEQLARAAAPNNSMPTRRQAVQTLREMVGDEAFFAGRWPPPVPVWRFTPIED